jgi:hypothetical protein
MIKSTRLSSCVLAAIAILCSSAIAQTDSQKAFAAIKSMPGTWEDKTHYGQPVTVTFKVTSAGSAVMSEILGKEDMISMFHMDGPDRLLMTHYCGTGNQPRMQASVSSDGKTSLSTSSTPRIFPRPTPDTCKRWSLLCLTKITTLKLGPISTTEKK